MTEWGTMGVVFDRMQAAGMFVPALLACRVHYLSSCRDRGGASVIGAPALTEHTDNGGECQSPGLVDGVAGRGEGRSPYCT